jgi:hypothetical protein
LEALEGRLLPSTYFVGPTGNDGNPGTLLRPFKTIQHGLNVAGSPGDTVEVRAGTYFEKLNFPHSGSAAGYITLEAYPGEHPVLNGTGVPSSDVGFGNDMVQLHNISYVKLLGFEIAFDMGTGSVDASGVHVEGSGTNIQIRNNLIHDITGIHAMGISVYGSSLTVPIANIVIDGNQIYHCQPADSETLTLNGNVNNFQITHNVVHDDNNIGIDMIGGECGIFGLSGPRVGLPVTRNGVCAHNTVYHIHANYGGGFAAGIYVDGGQNISLVDNVSYQNDLGLEVGAENAGYVASHVVVEDNLLFLNTQAGLVFGGFDQTVGRTRFCSFINNTVYRNDTLNTGNGQLWIQWASSNVVTNNIFYAAANDVLIGSDGAGNVGNVLDHNLYFATSGANNAEFDWNSATYGGFADYRAGTGEDAHSLFADPRFVNAGILNFHLGAGSPAIDAGSAMAGEFAPSDFDGIVRGSPPDIGAYENNAASVTAGAVLGQGSTSDGTNAHARSFEFLNVCPVGAAENSPALQCWVEDPVNLTSPVVTAESSLLLKRSPCRIWRHRA